MSFWTSCVFTGLARSGVVEAYASNEADVLGSRFADLRCCRVAVESEAPGGLQHVRIALELQQGVVHVAAAGPTHQSADSLCQLVGRAFDRAFAVLSVRRGAALRECPITTEPWVQREAC